MKWEKACQSNHVMHLLKTLQGLLTQPKSKPVSCKAEYDLPPCLHLDFISPTRSQTQHPSHSELWTSTLHWLLPVMLSTPATVNCRFSDLPTWFTPHPFDFYSVTFSESPCSTTVYNSKTPTCFCYFSPSLPYWSSPHLPLPDILCVLFINLICPFSPSGLSCQ